MSMLPDPESKIRALEAELAEMRRTHVKVKEECGTCGGRDLIKCSRFCATSMYEPTPDQRKTHTCPDCIDGLVLADGVHQTWLCYVAELNPDHPVEDAHCLGSPEECHYAYGHSSRCGFRFVISARLIEGER